MAPSKAVNAGGVATSALEMSQNSHALLSWSAEEVDAKAARDHEEHPRQFGKGGGGKRAWVQPRGRREHRGVCQGGRCDDATGDYIAKQAKYALIIERLRNLVSS